MTELERVLKDIIAAHERVLEVERWTEIPGIYRSEPEYLIAARGANQTLDEAVATARRVLYLGGDV